MPWALYEYAWDMPWHMISSPRVTLGAMGVIWICMRYAMTWYILATWTRVTVGAMGVIWICMRYAMTWYILTTWTLVILGAMGVKWICMEYAMTKYPHHLNTCNSRCHGRYMNIHGVCHDICTCTQFRCFYMLCSLWFHVINLSLFFSFASLRTLARAPVK